MAVEEPGRQVRGAPRCRPSGRRTGAALRARRGSAAPASSSPLLPVLRHGFSSRVCRAAGAAFPARAVRCLRGSGFPLPCLSSLPSPVTLSLRASLFFPPTYRLLLLHLASNSASAYFSSRIPSFSFCFFLFLCLFCLFVFLSLFILFLFLFHFLLSRPASLPSPRLPPAARHASRTRPGKAAARPGRPPPRRLPPRLLPPAPAGGEAPKPAVARSGGGERIPSAGRRRG